MRRIACLIVSIALLAPLPVRAQSSLPPHAWLFGAWVGGLYPPPSAVSAQECLAQPVVIFTRDIVMRVVITDTIPLSPEKKLPKIQVLTVAHLLGEAIKRIHRNE